MLNNLDAVGLERNDPARMIGQQTDATEIEVAQDLRPDSNFALYLPLVLQCGRIALCMVELQPICATALLNRKSKGVLVQINYGSHTFIGN